VSPGICLIGLARDIGSVECAVDDSGTLVRTHASKSGRELWVDVDVSSASAVLEVYVSVEGSEGGVALLGAVVTTSGSALLTDERCGVAMCWHVFGISPAMS
jgi:hypothetical protein